jgi:hypothetical protein
MKLHGIKLEGPATKTIAIPRETGNLVFVFQAILETESFNKIYPPPIPPVKKMAGGTKVKVLDDPEFKKKTQEWAENKAHWMFLKSIAATPELEFETIDMANPETWKNYDVEFTSAGLTEPERLKLLQTYIEVQGLDEEKIEAATKSFLAGLQEESENKSSQNTEANDGQSGEDVSA